MQTYLDCYPCVLRQALEAARMAGASEAQERDVIQQTLEILKNLPSGASPPEIGSQVHHLVRELTANNDPYLAVKHASTRKALEMLPKLRSMLEKSEDRLETAVRISIAGNIIDFGPNRNYDLWEVVQRVMSQDFAINDMADLWKDLAASRSILFLGDNAGETVFDRLLIETLGVPVTYVVRGGPVLNDATIEDALAAGIDQVAEVVTNGARMPGTSLVKCSQEFVERFESADLILAKGMGNYETLSEVSAPIYFLLQVKCQIIGMDVGAPVGGTIVKRGFSYVY